MPRLSLRLVLYLLVAPWCALVVAAAPKWNTLQAPHCLIVSQLGERETRAWATEFEQFTAALRNAIAFEDRHLAPLTVVLFAAPSGFKPYHPRNAAGKAHAVAGYFVNRQSWSAIALAERFSDEDTRHTVLHEATHWLTSASPASLPTWLNEGTADIFASFEVSKGHAILGKPDVRHLRTLREETWLPLLELLLTTNKSPIYSDNERKPLLYAQSWMLAHKLLFENPVAGRAILNRFLAASHQGTDDLTAMEAAFGQSLDAVEKDLRGYFYNGRFTLAQIPLPAQSAIDAPFAPASTLVVETALARLAQGARDSALARAHLDRALAADPTSPVPHELLATLALQENRHDDAAAAAQQALDRGSSDAWSHLLVAEKLYRQHGDRGTLAANARDLAGRIARAVALQPKLPRAYQLFASLAEWLPQPTVDDARLLADGHKLFPDDAAPFLGLAILQHKAGNDEEALRLLAHAAARPGLLDDTEKARAERLRADWQIEPLRAQLEEHRKNRRYAEALAVCDRILALPLQQRQRDQWENRREELQFNAVIRAADSAMAERKPAEAARLLEEFLTRPNLPAANTRKIQERLERVRLFLDQTKPQS